MQVLITVVGDVVRRRGRVRHNQLWLLARPMDRQVDRPGDACRHHFGVIRVRARTLDISHIILVVEANIFIQEEGSEVLRKGAEDATRVLAEFGMRQFRS
jgi:hypothetical protein